MDSPGAVIASPVMDVPHGFLTGPQSDEEAYGLVGGDVPSVFLDQIHSARVVSVREPFDENVSLQADGMVTDRGGVKLAIVTADCAPVLLADKGAGVIGAAHAGWRGAVGGVVENTVEAMVALGARAHHIVAAIGPCIHQKSYEVDDAMRAAFALGDRDFFAPGRPGHWQFDLPGYVSARLQCSGVDAVDVLPHDTYAEPDRFHSYRRATHSGTSTKGRQVSLIALRAS
ncbi:MAG: peptidoglycan editing factor PgeF [Qipengyuania sp.]